MLYSISVLWPGWEDRKSLEWKWNIREQWDGDEWSNPLYAQIMEYPLVIVLWFLSFSFSFKAYSAEQWSPISGHLTPSTPQEGLPAQEVVTSRGPSTTGRSVLDYCLWGPAMEYEAPYLSNSQGHRQFTRHWKAVGRRAGPPSDAAEVAGMPQVYIYGGGVLTGWLKRTSRGCSWNQTNGWACDRLCASIQQEQTRGKTVVECVVAKRKSWITWQSVFEC